MNKILFLLRGIPGAGKSTLAKALDAKHLESDMYFIDPVTQEYKFNPAKLKFAHEWCQNRTEGYMQLGEPKIAVSNTFTREWEMQAYMDLAKKHGYKVFSLIVENRHGGVNAHNVPAETLVAMKERFEVKL